MGSVRWAVGALLVQLSASLVPIVPLGIGAAKALSLAGGHAALSHAAAGAATHAVGAHTLTAAATLKGAVGMSSAAVVVAPSPERPRPQSKQLQAVTKILQVEFVRFRSAVFRDGVNSDPVEVVTRVQETAVTRAPIIKWALNLWVRGTLRETQASVDHTTYRKALSGVVVESYMDFTRGQVPTIINSLRELRTELLREVRYGFSTAPLRVGKLLFTSFIVTILGYMAQFARLPGLRFVRAGMRAHWPQLVEHLAATLEMNLADTERLLEAEGVASLPPLLLPAPGGELLEAGELLEDLKNRFEDATGFDLDGDGHVGAPPVEIVHVGFRMRTRLSAQRLGSRTRAAVSGSPVGAAGRAVVSAGSEARYSVSCLLRRIRRRGRAELDSAAMAVLDLQGRYRTSAR